MKNRYVRLALFLVCLVVFLISAYKVTTFVKDYYQASSDYTQAEKAFAIPKQMPLIELDEQTTETDIYEEAKEYFKDCDYKALKKLNTDICGWIVIPAVSISYPVLQHNDNQYYLTHLYNNTNNHVGSIFMDYRVAKDYSDFNTILYGHNMKDKSMFAKLHLFRKKKNWKKNPFIYIYTDKGIRIYKIFSAFAGDANGLSYAIGLNQDSSKNEFIDYAKRHAVYNTKIVPKPSDTILTLSTCSDSAHKYRMIVQAVYVKSSEDHN
jgi:sortase B